MGFLGFGASPRVTFGAQGSSHVPWKTIDAHHSYHHQLSAMRGKKRERPWRSARLFFDAGMLGGLGGLFGGQASSRQISSRSEGGGASHRGGGASHRGGRVIGPDGRPLSEAEMERMAHEFAVRLGEALVREAANTKELVKPWERDHWWRAWMLQGSLHSAQATHTPRSARLTPRGGSGVDSHRSMDSARGDKVLSRAEFRMAMRSLLHLKGSDSDALANLGREPKPVLNMHIDALFHSLDVNSSGHLELREIVPVIKKLRLDVKNALAEASSAKAADQVSLLGGPGQSPNERAPHASPTPLE